jgi:hypothetical protein
MNKLWKTADDAVFTQSVAVFDVFQRRLEGFLR